MALVTLITTFVFAIGGEVKYPAICIPRYLSDEKIQSVRSVEEVLSSKHGCMRIGEETIVEGDRAGDTFSIFTCCTSL